MSPTPPAWRTSLSLGLLAILAVGLPLAHGGTMWPAQLGAAVAAAAALAVSADADGVTPIAAAGLLGTTLATALQLVPLPPILLRIASPVSADLLETALGAEHLWPALRTASLDPPETARALTSAITCLAVFVAAAKLAKSRRHGEFVLATVGIAGIVVSSVGLGAALVGTTPVVASNLSFINPNHVAGFLDLSSFLCLGFAMRSHGERRTLWLLGFALAGAGVFLSLSRSGIAAFFVGSAVFTALHARRDRLDRDQRNLFRIAAVPIALSLAVSVAAWLAFDQVVGEMMTARHAADEAKVAMWPTAISMIARFPLTGIGRGAFAVVFPAFNLDPAPVTFTHVENEWLQPLLDLGIPAGLLLIGTFSWTWIRASRSPDLTKPEIGALAGVAALVAHDLFDFSLEVLGVAVPFSMVFGVLARSQRSLPTKRWMVGLSAAVFVLVSALASLYSRAHSADEDAARVARAPTAAEARALARDAMRWHPVDYLPHAAVGARLVNEGHCAPALGWLRRAMLLNPTAPEPHRLAARCLEAAGDHHQARREYRLAIALGDPEALAEVIRRFPRVDELLQVVPETPAPMLAVASALADERPADSERVFRAVWESFTVPSALVGVARTTLAQGKLEEALSYAREVEKQNPAAQDGYLIAAEALRSLRRQGAAEKELQAGASRIPGSPALLGALAELALAERHFVDAHRYAEAIVASDARAIASKRILVARAILEQGRVSDALQEAIAAREVFPDEAWTHLFFADVCARAGRLDDAIDALNTASSRPGAPLDLQIRIERFRSAREAQRQQQMRSQMLDLAAKPDR